MSQAHLEIINNLNAIQECTDPTQKAKLIKENNILVDAVIEASLAKMWEEYEKEASKEHERDEVVTRYEALLDYLDHDTAIGYLAEEFEKTPHEIVEIIMGV